MDISIPLEQEIKAYFSSKAIPFTDHSTDATRFQRLDFGYGDRERKRFFRFDTKEKRQRYNRANWPDVAIPEPHLFIIDDLAARKILAFAPNAGLVVRDNINRSYYLFTVVDLFLMPKVRVNRPIRNKVEGQKGKWLIDLRNGQRVEALEGIFTAIETYLDQRRSIFGKSLACYGDYVGEAISTGGIPRNPEHWDTDIKASH